MTNHSILVINAGSSSVKFRLFSQAPGLPLLGHGKVTDIGTSPTFEAIDDLTNTKTKKTFNPTATHEDSMREIVHWMQDAIKDYPVSAVAHRIVHGGPHYTDPVRVNSKVLQDLRQLIPLAPLHQPHNLMALGMTFRVLHAVPQVVCFDTAFHARHDPLFSVFATPKNLIDQGVRRYGFHGLSYEWISRTLQETAPDLAQGRVVVAHLGNGSSLCAMRNGKSVDTTMGMTALDGLPMGTRSGAIDAGAVIYMIRDLGMTASQVEKVLYNDCGLKGLSGISNDVKTLLESTDPQAKFAIDFYCMRTAQYIAMMATALGGIDGLVFTGGIGENATDVRNKILDHISFLSIPKHLVIPTDEERMMAIHTINILKGTSQK